MDIIQVGLLGITAVFLALFIKNYKSEYSILISIVACICIFIFLIGKLELVLSYINSVVELIPVDGRYLACKNGRMFHYIFHVLAHVRRTCTGIFRISSIR